MLFPLKLFAASRLGCSQPPSLCAQSQDGKLTHLETPRPAGPLTPYDSPPFPEPTLFWPSCKSHRLIFTLPLGFLGAWPLRTACKPSPSSFHSSLWEADTGQLRPSAARPPQLLLHCSTVSAPRSRRHGPLPRGEGGCLQSQVSGNTKGTYLPG